MSSKAYVGRQSSIARSDDGSPETWQLIGEVKDTAPGGETIDEYDSSNFDSGINKEFVTGMIDHGEVTVTMNHIPTNAGQQLLRSDFQSGARHTWGIKSPVSSIVSDSNTVPYYVTFEAFIKTLNLPKLGVAALAEASFILKITGAVAEVQEGTTTAPF